MIDPLEAAAEAVYYAAHNTTLTECRGTAKLAVGAYLRALSDQVNSSGQHEIDDFFESPITPATAAGERQANSEYTAYLSANVAHPGFTFPNWVATHDGFKTGELQVFVPGRHPNAAIVVERTQDPVEISVELQAWLYGVVTNNFCVIQDSNDLLDLQQTVEDAGLDSLDIVELTMIAEEDHDIVIFDNDLDHLTFDSTWYDLLLLIHNKISK